MADEHEPAKFMQCWIQAAADAQGQAAKYMADLEPLESQSQLIEFIKTATTGISESRKTLSQLGRDASKSEIQDVLQKVSCLCKCDNVFQLVLYVSWEHTRHLFIYFVASLG